MAGVVVCTHILGAGEAWIFAQSPGADAGGQALHRPVNVAVKEEGDGVTFLARAIAGAMRRREETVVRPAPEHIAPIGEEMPLKCRCMYPPSILGAKRQSRNLVLGKQGQETRVAMRCNAKLLLCNRFDKRVVCHSKRVLRFGERPIEMI